MNTNLSFAELEHFDLTKLPGSIILSNLDRLAKSERKITHVILKHIVEVENRRLFLDIGYDSTYKYLTQHLKYSGDQAYDRMDAARVLNSKPEISEKIEAGDLNLSQLVKVGQCIKKESKAGNIITSEQTEKILSQIENKTGFETEKILAIEMNYTPKVVQRIIPQSDGSVITMITYTAEQYAIIKRAHEHISHAVPSGDFAEAHAYIASKIITKVEGKEVKPKSTQRVRIFRNLRSNSGRIKRVYISVKVKRLVMARANYTCEHVHSDTKVKCTSRFQVQTDHIIPIAMGGTNDIENLRALCGVHNRNEAFKWGLSRPLV